MKNAHAGRGQETKLKISTNMNRLMKTAMLSLCMLVLFVSNGCISHQTNVRGIDVREDAVRTVKMNQPVAIRNVAPETGKTRIESSLGNNYYGDFHQYTTACINTLTKELERQKIQVSENASKVLSLAVTDAKQNMGAFTFTAHVTLTVKTGSGLEKQYLGEQVHGNGWGTSPAVEHALAHCVEQMLNDNDIISYLEN
jgi:hypothetical protein